MKRTKSFDSVASRRLKLRRHLLLGATITLYLLFLAGTVLRHFLNSSIAVSGKLSGEVHGKVSVARSGEVSGASSGEVTGIPATPIPVTVGEFTGIPSPPIPVTGGKRYGRNTGEVHGRRRQRTRGHRRGNFSELERVAAKAWKLGEKAWQEVENYDGEPPSSTSAEKGESCPSSLLLGGDGEYRNGTVVLSCGLAVGSAITIVGVPHVAHEEYVPLLERTKKGDGTVMVSQFVVELQGIKAVDGEDPPKILHLNPRLKGDWSKRPVIEHNTCFRMQWSNAMRCDGALSAENDDTVDGFNKCEKWEVDEVVESKESRRASWLKRFVGREQKPGLLWDFPFVEENLFVLTIRAGVEGFHMFVGGRHISSFPYQAGFALEEATGLVIKGDVDVYHVYATSLPTSHPSFSPQHVLEMSERWRALPLPEDPVRLFIGIISAPNHFAERMAIRKSWMQYPAFASSKAVARFFVGLSPKKEVNAAMKKEAEFFKDMVVLPFIDHYDLVVLKTIAICEFGVQNVTAAYVMKCDDDSFVRVDVILKQLDAMDQSKSLYMGNFNIFHKPLRSGKWAVTYEEWPEEIYPPYANGPGYLISRDIARFVVSQHANHSLRLFKMEDVSMGMWVEEFAAIFRIQYGHSLKFCQYGCIDNYFVSHYQSPRLMLCLWENLSRGSAQCCSIR